MDVKPYVLCSTNSYLQHHSDNVLLNDINSESLVDINPDPDFKPFALNSTNKHVHSHSNFDAQLDPGIHTDTHCIKVSLIDIHSESDVKPYVFCSTNSYRHHHSDNVSLDDINSDSLNDINSELHIDINSAPNFKPFVF